MKSSKLSFDLSDQPELVELLRAHAIETRESQKSILVKALEAYFSHHLESRLVLRAAEKTFAEWDNEDDEVYNDL